VQTVACAAEELSASIAEIASQLDRAAGLAGTAVAEAASTDVHVGGLAEAAQRIGEVVGLIQAIADQTNLLALNATIEAARAGEAGKGFAVVASEVKTLATQTGKATQEISSHIATVQSSTNGAVDAIRRITARMREINETTAGIAAAVVEQGSATEEISRNVAEAARGTQEMAQGLDTVTSTAQRTASAAATVTDAAEHVDGVAAGLEQEIERFLKRVAA
jgi:methyl-accepting chemotaxis protein